MTLISPKIDTWLDSSLRMREMAACAIARPDCFGYLSKQQEHARKTSSPTGWSRRYCVLKDAALYFYDDANAEKAFGVACLHGFRVHSSAPSSGGRKHAFELQSSDPTQRSYIFATETEMDKKRWIIIELVAPAQIPIVAEISYSNEFKEMKKMINKLLLIKILL